MALKGLISSAYANDLYESGPMQTPALAYCIQIQEANYFKIYKSNVVIRHYRVSRVIH